MQDNLKKEIFRLIDLKYEGGNWDFKEKWHENKAALLHDVIANFPYFTYSTHSTPI